MGLLAPLRWVVALLIAATFLACVTDELGDLTGDSASYILLARSLLDGHGYRSLESPGMPRHTRYPFVWPVLLAGVMACVGLRYWVLHLTVVALALAGLWLAWCLWRRWVGRHGAWVGVVLLAAAPCWMGAVTILFAEMLYVVWSLSVLLVIEAAVRDEQSITGQWVWLVIALWLAVFTRSVGLVLVAAVVLRLVMQAARTGRWWLQAKRLALVGMVVLVSCLGWLWWIQSGPTPVGVTYLEQSVVADAYTAHPERLGGMSALIERVRQQWLFYRYELARQFCAWHEAISPVPGLTLWIGWALVAAGAVRLWRAGEWTAILYLAGYLTALLVWPFRDPRFLVPILPVAIGCLLTAGEWLWHWRLWSSSSRLVRASLVAACLLALLANGWEAVRLAHRLRSGHIYPSAGERFLQAVRWLAQHSDPSAVIMTSRPSVVYLLTGRQALLPRQASVSDAAAVRQVRGEADYLILDEFDPSMTVVKEGLARGTIAATPRARVVDTWVVEVVK